MARDFSRTLRIGDQIQRDLAVLIPREIKDPRLGLVTVTGIQVARDLSAARVFVTVMGRNSNDEARQDLEILQEVSGLLRSLLGKSMRLRTMPQLQFVYDSSVSRGAELSALIERAIAEDNQHQN